MIHFFCEFVVMLRLDFFHDKLHEQKIERNSSHPVAVKFKCKRTVDFLRNAGSAMHFLTCLS